MAVGHPVKIYPEGPWMQGSDEPLNIEPLLLEHLQGDVDDPHPEALSLQVFRDAGKTNGIHLKDRGGGDYIANGAQLNGTPSKIVYGWWM